jgi:hypothetical protein
MADKLHRHDEDRDLGFAQPLPVAGSPGKSTLTSKLYRRAVRDDHGVEEGAEAHVDRAAGSSGSSLPDDLRARFETSIGTDLSSVRIHTGGDSETAAASVGAKAYTVGNDIHFGAGHYDPSSHDGMLLIAHEVAHTVQQAGTTPTRQNKLEVSSAGDAAEIDADCAAEAMVSGTPATIAGAPARIAREEEKKPEADSGADPDDIAWAESVRGTLETLQGDIASAQTALNAEATASVTALKLAQSTYTEFETKYDEAAKRFDEALKKAKKSAEDKATVIKIVAGAALGLAAPAAAAAIGKAGEAVAPIGTAAQLAGIVGLTPKPAEKPEAGGAGANTKVDWKALLATTLSTFEAYLKDNKSLTEMDQKVDGYLKFLGTVIEGKYKGTDPTSDATGSAAADLADNAIAIGSELTEVEIATPSQEATTFSNSVVSGLGGLTGKKIEQDIAIRWMSQLQGDVWNRDGTCTHGNLDEIDVIDDYLAKLGVIDAKGSRLGFDTGTVTTDADEQIIWVAAQIEQEAMSLVGQTVTWKKGLVTASNGSLWRATGPEGLGDQEDVSVTVTGYHNPGVPSTWSEMKHPTVADMKSRLRFDFTLKVSAAAPT